MSYDGYSEKSFLNFSGKPADRESCKLCNRYVYFHQPILFCKCCRHIYHGTCLKISNDLVFILQQVEWNCEDCRVNKGLKYFCGTCLNEVIISSKKIRICKLCRNVVHLGCLKDDVCTSCEPNLCPEIDISLSDISNENIKIQTDEYFRAQPIFTPFEFYEKNLMELIPSADSLSDQLQICNSILNSCHYMTEEDYISSNQSEFFDAGLVSINIDGARTNFSKLEVFNRVFNVNNRIVGYFICESNVTEHEAQTIFLEGYNKFVLDRILKDDNSRKQKGSGLITLIRQNLNRVKVCPELCKMTLDFECLTTELMTNNSKYLFINAYRSPSGNYVNFLTNLEHILETANSRREFKTIILGDFNINLYNPSSTRCKEYLNCIFSNGFVPLISRATHFVSDRPTLIDHILSNDLSDISSSCIFRAKISHHLPVCVNIRLDVQNTRNSSSKPRVRINEYLLNKFIDDLKDIDRDIDLDLSAESCFTDFYSRFKECYDRWFVETNDLNIRSTNNLRKDWITIGLAKSCLTRENLYERWTTNRHRSDWNCYLNYSKKLNRLIDKAKYDYFSKKLDENKEDLKKTWRLINNILGRKRQNRLLTFPQDDAAHNFNKYFVSVASDLISKTYSTDDSKSEDEYFLQYLSENNLRNEDVLDSLVISDKDVASLITKLSNSKSSYFSPKILKLVSYNLSPILSKLFNKCISDGYFPKELKIAKVIPLFKNKGSVSELSNYRPISMLPSFSKIFEKLLHKSIMDHLDSHELINDSQYGFRKKRSTLHALINATENIYHALDLKLHTLGIFIDFSRAFDTIDHSILLKKLNHYGIKGDMLKLLNSYLSNRKQFVSYGGNESTLLNVSTGVPQGSVLGPLLFIIFINDITNISNIASFVLFADDLNLFVSHTNRETLYRHANQILDNLYRYCVANKLIMNFNKCCFMEFGYSESNQDFYLGTLNQSFIKVEKCKFLGVFINVKLNWDDQIDHVTSQVAKSCGTMYRVRLHVPRKILKMIYNALIQPYLIYCVSIWGFSLKSARMSKLFILQKKCVRIVVGKTDKINGIFYHTKPIFTNLRILTIFNLYTFFTAVEGMKILKTSSPKFLMDNFGVSERSDLLILPKFNFESFKAKSFIFNSSKILNYLLGNDIPYMNVISDSVFKSRLKFHLLTLQGQSRAGDDDWLPCNHDIFSSVILF